MFRKHFDHLAQNNSFIKSVVCDSNARLKNCLPMTSQVLKVLKLAF